MADIDPKGVAGEITSQLKFNSDGLIPVVTQQHDTGEVLMMAWANLAAIEMSWSKGLATYFSRSRNELWTKGETSGFTQQLKEMRTDCDGDCLLYVVDAPGAACHQGRRSCFSHRVEADGSIHTDCPIITED